jgi:uncharacterized protein
MSDPVTLLVITLSFLLAGTVKGVIGLGLPTVSLGLLTLTVDLTTAMSLMLIPSLVTNLWQGLVGGNGIAIAKRIWFFLLLAGLGIALGARALSHWDSDTLSMLLGLLLIVYGASGIGGLQLNFGLRTEFWMGPIAGVINGVLTGMTGSFVVPGVMYLTALGLSRQVLVQAMGMLFSISTIGLAVALGSHGYLTQELAIASGMALLPACIGMLIGQRIRRRLSETRFKQFFFVAILILGGTIASQSII